MSTSAAVPIPAVDLELPARFPEEWERALAELCQPKYRARQLFRWLAKRGVYDVAEMSDLSLDLRERLAQLGLGAPIQVASVRRSVDGTRKLLLEGASGSRIECVLIPMTRLDGDADSGAEDEDDDSGVGDTPLESAKTKVTLCVSTQFGCAMGCRFCASGRAGLLSGLKASEIVGQVLIARAHLEPDEDLRNLVFMGMGEPLHHYEETARALRVLMHPDGLGMSPRRITVSTVGLVPGIRRLGADFAGKIGLAISLHAPDDAIRSHLMPMNDRYPISELIRALRDYPLPRRRRITIEYTLIDGVNDAPAHAVQLGKLLREIPVKINLIPMNPVPGSGFNAPPVERVSEFQERLSNLGYSCFVRTRRGDEVDAACGQLALSSDLVPLRKHSILQG